ncbi:hypothetical protein F5X99DRAFT_127887 [Biscogniauxia marginata]|nr:hypothetical protein F5X99DRAFT_127887 [Biscogniauxia marginata]
MANGPGPTAPLADAAVAMAVPAAKKEEPSSSKPEVKQPEEASSSSLSSSLSLPPRFTRFTSLPPEIRYMIYDLALPPDVPELYILQADKIPPTTTANTGTAAGPGAEKVTPPHPTVYTAYPVLMHVSREARTFAQSRTQLRWSAGAQCAVPHRAFRADLDVLYISWFSFMAVFRRPELFLAAELVARLQHVAVDMILTTNLHRLVQKFRQLRALRTLRVVFGSAAGPFWVCAALRLRDPLERRYALRAFAGPELQGVVRGGPMTRPRSLEWYLQYVHGEASHETLSMLIMSGEDGDDSIEIGAWDREKRELKLKIMAQVLVKYKWSPQEGSCWAEKGKDNMTNLVSGMAWDFGIG